MIMEPFLIVSTAHSLKSIFPSPITKLCNGFYPMFDVMLARISACLFIGIPKGSSLRCFNLKG